MYTVGIYFPWITFPWTSCCPTVSAQLRRCTVVYIRAARECKKIPQFYFVKYVSNVYIRDRVRPIKNILRHCVTVICVLKKGKAGFFLTHWPLWIWYLYINIYMNIRFLFNFGLWRSANRLNVYTCMHIVSTAACQIIYNRTNYIVQL